jgi:hypothetical protein
MNKNEYKEYISELSKSVDAVRAGYEDLDNEQLLEVKDILRRIKNLVNNGCRCTGHIQPCSCDKHIFVEIIKEAMNCINNIKK